MAAVATVPATAMSFLRTPSLREGGGYGWLWFRTRRTGLLEDCPALAAGAQDEHDDAGEQCSRGDGDLAESEGVAQTALKDGADRVHDAEGHHVQAENSRPEVLGRPQLHDGHQPRQDADV